MGKRRSVHVVNKDGHTNITTDFRLVFPHDAKVEEMLDQAYEAYQQLLHQIRTKTGVWVV